MTSRPWTIKDLSPAALDQAIEASRRSGMPLEDWLNSAIRDSARAHGVADAPQPRPQGGEGGGPELSDIHDRLDSITRQIERVSGAAPSPEGAVARQLNDAISRLDQRLAGLAQTAPARASSAAPASRPAANSVDAAVAEIAARQGELDNRARPQRVAAPPMAPPMMPAMAPAMPAPDLSGFERRLDRISEQMSAWRPAQIEQSITGFREELGEIRRSLTEAMPRRVLESLENEVRAVARKLDDSRHNGVDGQALNGIERALSEIHQTLRTLKPAEQLAGFDTAIANLSGKLDLIVRSSQHGGIQELEAAIGALRALVSQVASGDAVARLHSDVQVLAARIDQLVLPTQSPGALSALEQRIALLTEALETRERPLPADTGHIENAVRALADRIDRMQVGGPVDASALEHLEQRIGSMLQRVEQAIPNNAPLGRIEEGLSHIIAYLENQREGLSTILNAAPSTAPSMNEEVVEAVRRELSDIRFGQSEAERRAQDSLEVVHNALNQVVDRLGSIEKDLQQIKVTPAPQRAAEAPRVVMPAAAPMPAPAPRAMAAPMLPNPVQMHGAAPAAEPRQATRPGAVPEQALVPAFTDEARPATAPAQRPASAPRAPIDPNLPPDHPLEPGVRPQDLQASALERAAASEAILKDTPMSGHESATKANFIAAARRAAQQAAAAPAAQKAGRVAVLADKFKSAPAQPANAAQSVFSNKLRTLLVGASIVMIVLGAVRIAMNVMGESDTAKVPPVETPDKSSAIVPPTQGKVIALPQRAAERPTVVASSTDPAIQFAPVAGALGVPPKVIAKVADKVAEHLAEKAGAAEPAPIGIPAMQIAAVPATEITGSVATPPAAAPIRVVGTAPVARAPDTTATTPKVFAEQLPEAIGGAVLRDAALKGDPKAAFEIASRYADGKGVPVNYPEALKWFDRAAQKGLVPAHFRLGSLYEKGLGTPKDIGAAKRSYIAAAEGSNAKAMHNLAVLFADGGGQGPDYKTASEWFRKAADYGLADSQYNLAVLYARGIGIEQNLIESYKWFSLAAAQGDADAGKKRDDVAKRMDQQSLSAARLAIQTYMPLSQPEGAVNVAAPAGGWDAAPVQTAKSAPRAKK